MPFLASSPFVISTVIRFLSSSIDVLCAKLGRYINVPHLRERCEWRVVIGEPLEEWASIHCFWRLRRKLRYPTPISKHNEATESTDDIRLGFPCDLIAVICISARSHIDWSIVSITYAVFRAKTQFFTPGTFNLMRYTLVLAVM